MNEGLTSEEMKNIQDLTVKANLGQIIFLSKHFNNEAERRLSQ